MIQRHGWAISEEGLQLVIAVASRDEFYAEVREKALAARAGQPMQNTHAVEKRGRVAVVPVMGPLFRHANLMTELSGATSYDALRKDLQATQDDPAIDARLLCIDSPGGEANGMIESADAIRAMGARAGGKPIWAYIGGSGTSAALGIAAAADRVFVSPTAIVGSIGVLASYVDDTKAAEARGEKKITIVSSQSPNKYQDPATDEGRALVQQRVDDLAAVFIDRMAQYRGMTPKQVQERGGKGGVMVGEKAVAAGFADGVSNFEAVLAELAATVKGSEMSFPKTVAALGLDASATDEQCEERAKALVQNAQAIVSATGAKDPDAALGVIRANAEAAQELASLKAERAKEQAGARKIEFRTMLEKAIGAKHLTIGQLSRVVPTLLDEVGEAAATAALAAVKEQTAGAVLDAVCSADVSERALVRAKAYFEASTPVTPTAAKEPDLSGEAAKITDESEEDRAISAEFAKQRQQLDAQRKK